MAAAQRALTLNPDLPEAHTALGWTKTLFAIDLPTAEHHFEQALLLAPSSAQAHAYYSFWLAAYGRFGAAHEHADRAQEIDPLWQHNPFTKCEILLCERRFGDLERMTRQFIALDARFEGMFWYLSNALAGLNRLPEAIEVMERSVGVVHRLPYFLALLGQWYGRGGRRADAKAVLDELKANPQCSASWLALVCAGLRDLDSAFVYLDQAIDEHNDQCQVTFMAVDHRFDELREDRRFELALSKIGLPHSAGSQKDPPVHA